MQVMEDEHAGGREQGRVGEALAVFAPPNPHLARFIVLSIEQLPDALTTDELLE